MFRVVLRVSALCALLAIPRAASCQGLEAPVPEHRCRWPEPCFCGKQPWPYNSSSCLYGYVDNVYGRGPLPNLGAATLQPGFRGYGTCGSPGYGLGMRPATRLDLQRYQRSGLKSWFANLMAP